MSHLPDDDRVILDRLIPFVEQHEGNIARLAEWVATLNPREQAVLLLWAQAQVAPETGECGPTVVS